VRPLIPYLKCTKTNAKIAGLDISDFFRTSKHLQEIGDSVIKSNPVLLSKFVLADPPPPRRSGGQLLNPAKSQRPKELGNK